MLKPAAALKTQAPKVHNPDYFIKNKLYSTKAV